MHDAVDFRRGDDRVTTDPGQISVDETLALLRTTWWSPNLEREPLVRYLALAVSLVEFVLTLWLWSRFDPASSGFQFVE